MSPEQELAEQRITEAVLRSGAVRWNWAPWGALSSGRPYLQHDIVVVMPHGGKRIVQAAAFVRQHEDKAC